MHTFIRVFLISLLPLCAAPAFAWGGEGHRLTGLIASELLEPKARIRLREIVPEINLADYANQMDVFRMALSLEIPGSEKWHYDNQPICGARAYRDYCPDGNCASSKIPVYFKVLADVNATREARAQAAMFLIHMVGDIHQPLHAADDADLGGNQKMVLLPNAEMPQNLHRIWDSDLVKALLRGQQETAFAKSLVARFREKEILVWQQGDVRDWMQESHALSQKIVYGNLPEHICGVAWPMEKTVKLPPSYVDAALAILPQQITKAGARVAWLLNRALSNAGPLKVAPQHAIQE